MLEGSIGSRTNLLEALPDLIVLLHPDGMLLRSYGGRGVAGLKPAAGGIGKSIEELWPRFVTRLLRQLMREAVARRAAAEAMFRDAGLDYDMRVTVQGTDMAICVIRAVLGGAPSEDGEVQGSRPRTPDRSRVMLELKELISIAALCNDPMAIVAIRIDGVSDIEQLICMDVAQKLMRDVVARLRPLCCWAGSSGPWRYLERLGDTELLLILATSDRELIKSCVAQVCDSLRQPVSLGGAVFHLTPYCGVALLGREAPSHQILVRHASVAATEARRSRSARVRFYSEAAEPAANAPIDIAHDLEDAITGGEIHLRYLNRHDLATGRLVAWVGYLQWRHRLYGEIPTSEVLRLAEVTGLSAKLSAAALRRLGEDFRTLARHPDAAVRVSFGPPRQYLFDEAFVQQMERFVSEGIVPAERLELRISVQVSLARAAGEFDRLAQRGVQLVVDEIGPGVDFSLDWLARAPIRGLQLKGGSVQAMLQDEEALKMCRAATALAKSLRWTPLAVGVDTAQHRQALLELGCEQGSGELYGESLREDCRHNITEGTSAVVAA